MLHWLSGVSVLRHFQLLSKLDISKWKQYSYLSTKSLGEEQICLDYMSIRTQEAQSASNEWLQESFNDEDNYGN